MTGARDGSVPSRALHPEFKGHAMRHIRIERAVLIDGQHTPRQTMAIGEQITAERAAYLVRQGCAAVAETGDSEAAAKARRKAAATE
jgi:hypothetical protein